MNVRTVISDHTEASEGLATMLDTADRPIAPAPAPAAAALAETVDRACRRIAPLWPLKHFVAVNPFLGFTGRSFEATAAHLRRVGGIDMVMPRAFYRAALAEGRIDRESLSEALAAHAGGPGVPDDLAALEAAIGRERPAPGAAETVTDAASAVTGRALAPFVTDEVARHCAAHFDAGQASWRSPFRHLPLFAAFKAVAALDRSAEVHGIRGFREAVAALPDDPLSAIEAVASALELPPAVREDYFHRVLLDVGGWAAFTRYRQWEAELHGGADHTPAGLLAVRLAYDLAVWRAFGNGAVSRRWAEARAALGAADGDSAARAIGPDLVLQAAYEIACQKRLAADLAGAMTAPPAPRAAGRKPFQAAFCIDVRSEIFRRALESVAPAGETIGFAGFFGVPIEYVPFGSERGGAQCPVLLTPAFRIPERVAGVDGAGEAALLEGRRQRLAAGKVWKAFKASAISSFVFVETVGLAFAARLVGDAAGLTRPHAHPRGEGLPGDVAARLKPDVTGRGTDGAATGLDEDTRVAVARQVLTAMSMTRDFARIVLLAGHGSTTVNNPHATGLDCGACGGHTGEANARVAAMILNDPAVRARLPAEGIALPADTVFVAGQHDTTTDEVSLFDREDVPDSHRDDLAALEDRLAAAAALARAERAGLLGIAAEGPAPSVDRRVRRRTRDWSEVRPEWGLAGNAAFIAAPRARTAGLSLEGRAFLHSYDWRADPDFAVLELIMTAPMVVASWINLQYYGSVVDNRAFGCGNKVLHNVVGTLGVLEGNGGDLRTGLPLQSVHDGDRFVHEPVRLNVFIEAPTAAIDRVIGKHAAVRDLVDNGWVHLWALSSEEVPVEGAPVAGAPVEAAPVECAPVEGATVEGATVRRYAGGLTWVDGPAPRPARIT